MYRACAEAVLGGLSTPGMRWQLDEVQQELVVDGAIRGRLRDMNTGRRWFFEGRWRQVDPARRLACSLRVRADQAADEATVGVAAEFVEHEGGCELVVVHFGLRSALAMKESQSAWTQALERLGRVVSRGRA